jgi:hypothetical protein
MGERTTHSFFWAKENRILGKTCKPLQIHGSHHLFSSTSEFSLAEKRRNAPRKRTVEGSSLEENMVICTSPGRTIADDSTSRLIRGGQQILRTIYAFQIVICFGFIFKLKLFKFINIFNTKQIYLCYFFMLDLAYLSLIITFPFSISVFF